MIGIEPEEIAQSGNFAFKLLCEATGWAISSEKSPLPARSFVVIGVDLDLTNVPEAEAVVKVTKKRVAQLKKTLRGIMSSEKLGSGDAAALTGALGFTLCATFRPMWKSQTPPVHTTVR